MKSQQNELLIAIAAAKKSFFGVAIISGAVNVLYLTGSFYMLEVYDRVVPSRSVPTLVGISIMALILYSVQGMLDITRNRVLSRVGSSLDARLSGRIFDLVSRLPLTRSEAATSVQPLRDLDQVRSFISGNGPSSFFDLPWIPIYLFICFAFHPYVGITVLAGVLILFSMALLTEIKSRGPALRAAKAAGVRQAQMESARSNAEVVRALGMTETMMKRWMQSNDSFREANQNASDAVANLGGLAKVTRMILQSTVLALGAWLVIHQEATGGIIIASSILSARAFAPVELAIANWKGFVAARQSWRRLSDVLARIPTTAEVTKLPRPKSSLSVENIFLRFPGQEKFVLTDICFKLIAGQGLGIIGPSASGKSTLARVLTGVWLPERGKVTLDGAALDQWTPDELGSYLGYLPQNVELFSGTIAENIARFKQVENDEETLAAARSAGIHEMILALPKGYDTDIGEAGSNLSAGQRQRVGLARALFGNPFLVVLDEPNSNLDAEGEAALSTAIKSVRDRGGIAVIIAHRPSALAACDTVLIIGAGRVVKFGGKEEVLSSSLKTVPESAVQQPASPRPVQQIPQKIPGSATHNVAPRYGLSNGSAQQLDLQEPKVQINKAQQIGLQKWTETTGNQEIPKILKAENTLQKLKVKVEE